jgi:hypothetical protein
MGDMLCPVKLRCGQAVIKQGSNGKNVLTGGYFLYRVSYEKHVLLRKSSFNERSQRWKDWCQQVRGRGSRRV